MDSTSSEKKVYKARCHCGDIKFTVAISPLETGATKVVQCNCSICTKKGYLLVYPLREDVVFQCGEDKLADYLFGKKRLPQRFCPNCGTSILVDFKNVQHETPRKTLGISVSGLASHGRFEVWQLTSFQIRTFDDIEDIMDKLQYTYFDGKRKLNPPYNTED